MSALRDALAGLEMMYMRDGEDANEYFERVADAFHRETGYLRPGKDCRIHDIETREAEWDAWRDAKLANARAALSAVAEVPAEPSEAKDSEPEWEPSLCIKPACGEDCSGCSRAISAQTVRDYAIRYAFLRGGCSITEWPPRSFPTAPWAVRCEVDRGLPANKAIEGAELDAAIDAALASSPPKEASA